MEEAVEGAELVVGMLLTLLYSSREQGGRGVSRFGGNDRFSSRGLRRAQTLGGPWTLVAPSKPIRCLRKACGNLRIPS